MYKILTQKEIKEFDQNIMNQIRNDLFKEVKNYIITNNYTKPILCLGVCYKNISYHDIDFKLGKKLNFWVECEIAIIGLNNFYIELVEIIIFDEMPNVVLDSYNKLKEKIENNLKSKS